MPDDPLDRLATKKDFLLLKADLHRALLVQGVVIVVATVALLKLLLGGAP